MNFKFQISNFKSQISNEDRNTKISLATFEELFCKFYQKFDNTFLDKLINQTINSLSNDIGKYKRKNEIDRLRNRVKLSDIVFSFERYLDFHTDDDIPPYSERNEIIMRFLDKDFLNSHEIVVKIESNDDFAFKEAYFEHI
ncbi:hypothetical protein CXF68_20060 [Tenacibaculum sp. Bg11-29]|uniref:hypothetical protein n=1 Tax=Tenacibaculum sp. Bg11-29 TaxID=2058306 RepID=UPI000C33D9BA|nr:hypothetical protein [Tenacibaculum sp. Bg11-29]PKH52851.1 hypothetical protein CXF68_20060 [Tenacibaculum sp. Bg11-29]